MGPPATTIRLILTALLLTSCASGPGQLGQSLTAGPWALAPGRIEVWYPYGRAALPDPEASIQVSSRANEWLAARVSTCAGEPLSAAQLALFGHLAQLLRQQPELWQTRPSLGPLVLPGACEGVLVVQGRLQESGGWLVLGAIGGDGRLLTLRHLSPAADASALSRLLP